MTQEELVFSSFFSSILYRRTRSRQPVRPAAQTTSLTPITYEMASSLLQSGQITNFRISPDQTGAGPGNTRIILVSQPGQEYEVIASYNQATNSLSRPVLTYEAAVAAIQGGQVVNSQVDPQNQQGLLQGNTRITLTLADGRKFDLVARYDQATNNIFPPI